MLLCHITLFNYDYLCRSYSHIYRYLKNKSQIKNHKMEDNRNNSLYKIYI